MAVCDAPDDDRGTQRALKALALLEREYPTAARCLRDDLEASLARLKLPVAHRKSIGTANALERSFGEERRQLKRYLAAKGQARPQDDRKDASHRVAGA